MKNNIIRKFLFGMAITCFLPAGLAQQKEPSTFLLYDQLVGIENTDLFKGKEYIEKHRIVNQKHKFFDSFDYVQGDVVYDGQPFYDVELKYNIFEDLVLVQVEGTRGKTRFSLFKEDLDNFRLNGHHFINIKAFENSGGKNGIYEVLAAEGDFRLLKKHRLVMKKILEGRLMHHEFEQDEPEYFYLSNGELITGSQKDLLARLSAVKDEIKDFFRENRRLRRNEPEEFHERLFNKISSLITTR